MSQLTDKQVSQEESVWAEQKALILRRKQIRREKWELRLPFLKASTTKLLMWFLFANCTALELFAGYVTLQGVRNATVMGVAPDLSPLNALISPVVGEVIGFALYAIKSMRENTKGGIVYETAVAATAECNAKG